jgi:hypothetical protein
MPRDLTYPSTYSLSSAGREAPRWRKEVGLALHLLTATGAAFALLALIAAAQADWRWRHAQARLLGHPRCRYR